ncbi:MOSC domain-containing protein [Streptomyces sp. GMY02]|uniref:MOSC and FAD-binding oxidoreductase domain-containing protein n=1 Tax=Streptomyces sp. GMY02 TaxID=1333528 RepID=UPI001C2C69B5|nr:MOSC and FAD-binding oxidoreductase domain-containing protein [Streptomyces sp. GMY02]QXE37689.1 MOSC domain-containing protein [Streptomyces sp. GMY02]
MATLLSVNVGMPKDVSWQGRTVHTGAWKVPVQGPRMVRRLNIDGDGQGDLEGHGGEYRAVLVYQLDSYRYWRKQLERDDLRFGHFGENFTVDGLADDEVCIGDRYRMGEAEFEVTQPRVTCYRVGMRLGVPAMASLLVAHHRPGFYLRVIEEGRVQAGDEIIRTRTGPGALSVADIDALLYLPGRDPAKLRTARSIPALSPGWRQSFDELAEAADQAEAAAQPDKGTARWPGFKPLRVARVVPETPTVSSIHLEPTDRQPLPAARPGQYLAIRITDGPQPAPVRSYSLSSAPGRSDAGTGNSDTGDAGKGDAGTDSYRISVKREPHGLVSTYLHTKVRPGTLLDVASPRGDFVLGEGTSPVVLLSAGIGVTPVLAMLYRLASERDPGPVWWIHTARNREQHAFADEARRLLARLPDAHQHIFYTAPPDETRAGRQTHVTYGHLTPEALAALGIPTDADVYLCGPESFMTDIGKALGDLGFPRDRVHTELFGARTPINPGIAAAAAAAARPHQPPGPPGSGPLVTFTRSGISAPWSAVYNSLLELAEACDIPTRWSCRTGVCHTCVTPLVSGEVDYTTPPLEPPAPGNTLICCATPTTEVLVDL